MVERYPRTMAAKLPTASKITLQPEPDGNTESAQSSVTLPAGEAGAETGLEGVSYPHRSTQYHIEDPNAPGGKREVAQDQISKSYEIGGTIVHISPLDRGVIDLDTKAGLEIMGFISQQKVQQASVRPISRTGRGLNLTVLV